MVLSLCMWLRPEMFTFVFLPPAVPLLMNARLPGASTEVLRPSE
jgi:hypothetical protein